MYDKRSGIGKFNITWTSQVKPCNQKSKLETRDPKAEIRNMNFETPHSAARMFRLLTTVFPGCDLAQLISRDVRNLLCLVKGRMSLLQQCFPVRSVSGVQRVLPGSWVGVYRGTLLIIKMHPPRTLP
jgi:hypothetical protein